MTLRRRSRSAKRSAKKPARSASPEDTSPQREPAPRQPTPHRGRRRLTDNIASAVSSTFLGTDENGERNTSPLHAIHEFQTRVQEQLPQLQSFFAPLQRLRPRRQQGLWNKIRTSLFGFFLLDKVEYKNFFAWMAAYHYIPVMCCVLALTVNTILFVFFALIFPLIQDPEAVVGMKPLRIVITHLGIVVGITTLGYKAMSIIIDCLIDSLLVIVDPDTHDEVFFYGLLTDSRQVASSKRLFSTFVSVMIVIAIFVYRAVYTPMLGIVWESNDKNVFYVCMATVVLSTLYGLGYLVYASQQGMSIALSSPDMATIWSKVIPRCRRRSVIVNMIAATLFSLENGFAYGISCFCEGMLYLNMPHMLLVAGMKITLFFDKVWGSVKLAVNDPFASRVTKYLILPWLVVGFATLLFIDNWLLALVQIPPFLTLFTSAMSFVRADSEAHGGHRHDEDSRSSHHRSISSPGKRGGRRQSIAFLALRLFMLNTKDRFRRLPHYKAGLMVRVVLRSVLLVLHIALVLLGIWVSVQASPSFAGEKTATFCLQTENGIMVGARQLTAELYGMAEHHDPSTLVYEAEAHLYRRDRYHGLCDRQWPGGLLAGDLAYFSTTTYLENDDLTAMLTFYKKYRDNAADWETIPVNIPRNGSANFRHYYSRSKKVHVVAVRGTDVGSPHDFLQNIVIYAETFIFQMLGQIVPLSSFLPERSIIDFIAAASAVDSALLDGDSWTRDHHYHTFVENYVRGLEGEVVLTGHSLGGVVAQVVGARLRRSAVAFGSPGITLLQKKFQIDPNDIDAYITNVVASNDMITRIDKLGGNVQHIQCEHRRGDICHSIELHTIRLWTMCSKFREVTRMNGTYTVHPQTHQQLLAKVWPWMQYNTGENNNDDEN